MIHTEGSILEPVVIFESNKKYLFGLVNVLYMITDKRQQNDIHRFSHKLLVHVLGKSVLDLIVLSSTYTCFYIDNKFIDNLPKY